MTENLEQEWSHFIDADEISGETLRLSITPDNEARKNLVRRLGVESIDSLKADLQIKREQGGMVVHIAGHIHATITQACVVSLDPVESRVNEDFEAWFADPDQAIQLSKVKHDKNIKVNGETAILEENEDPEAIVEGQIDLGELVTQHLSLNLDPYPHAEGVEYEFGDDDPRKTPDAFKNNPFAALKDWKTKLEDS